MLGETSLSLQEWGGIKIFFMSGGVMKKLYCWSRRLLGHSMLASMDLRNESTLS